MSNQASKSPTSRTLSFPRAIGCLIEGAQVTRLEWNDSNVYSAMRDGYLMIHRDNRWHQWIVNDGDLLGVDWVVRKE